MSPNQEQEEIPIKSRVYKQKYEKAFSECKKLRTFIKIAIGKKRTPH